jgi:hypothetical protein
MTTTKKLTAASNYSEKLDEINGPRFWRTFSPAYVVFRGAWSQHHLYQAKSTGVHCIETAIWLSFHLRHFLSD